MKPHVEFVVGDWERLERGSPEDRACFTALGIRAGEAWLTEAEDTTTRSVRRQIHLSAYPLAEWLAWNYWRLIAEVRCDGSTDWALSHRMSSIGGGWVWPNVTIQSDGARVSLRAIPTEPKPYEPIRYLALHVSATSVGDFTRSIELFLAQVRGRLRDEGVPATNLDAIWEDVMEERADPEASRRRRIEALLGYDPDEAPKQHVETVLRNSDVLGAAAADELAAGADPRRSLWTADQILDRARNDGFDTRPRDGVSLAVRPFRSGEVPAWVVASAAAQELRRQERLGEGPLPDDKLTQLLAVDRAVLEAQGEMPISYEVDSDGAQGRIVLRATKWREARRFDLTRLLGDRFIREEADRLLPATRTYTYRQKWQRAFAAELLCPYESLTEYLAGDTSEEARSQAAEKFDVSPLVVTTILANHGDIERNEVDTARAA